MKGKKILALSLAVLLLTALLPTDDAPVFLWLVLMSIGAICMAAVVFFGRKRIIQKRDQ